MTEITLQLQFPLTPEHAADHAQLCVDGAKKIDGIDLDFSAESLEYVDTVIESWRTEEADLAQVATVLFTIGCYVGEVFVRHADAKWVVPENPEEETFPLLLEMPDGSYCRAIDHVFKRFEDPEEGDYLLDFFAEVSAESNEEKELVAVLRTINGNNDFENTVVHKKIADDLGVFACRKIEAGEGIVAIDYIQKTQLAESDMDESQLIEYCYENFFASKIEVNSYEQDGDEMLSFEHEEGLVSAIIGHAEAYSRFAEMLKTSDITIVIVNVDSILATKTGSSFEAGFHKIVEDAKKNEENVFHLDPGVYHWTAEKLTRVEAPVS